MHNCIGTSVLGALVDRSGKVVLNFEGKNGELCQLLGVNNRPARQVVVGGVRWTTSFGSSMTPG